jgi:hypothetical protein
VSGGATRVAYLCWPNGRSLHNVGRSLVGPMARHGVAVDVVDSRAWFERPTPADVVFLAHLSFLWPGFPYRRYARDLVAVVHDPDEVSTFGDRLTWRDEPMHHVPALAAFDRVLTCSREMTEVLGARYGVRAYHAATHPHNAAAIAAAAAARPARRAGAPVRFVSAAFGPARASWGEVLGRARRPRFWTRDERDRPSPRQLRSAFIRAHRKNTAWLDRLGRAWAPTRAPPPTSPTGPPPLAARGRVPGAAGGRGRLRVHVVHGGRAAAGDGGGGSPGSP